MAIVVSRYNASVTDRLLAGALAAYAEAFAGMGPTACDVYDAPGSFELVALADAALASGRYDGVVALGCIVKGQTKHDEYLAHAVTQGLIDIAVKHTRPTSNGVLTVLTQAQALARTGAPARAGAGKRAGGVGGVGVEMVGNKGHEAMTALLATIEQLGFIQGSFMRAGSRRGPIGSGTGGSSSAGGAARDARPDKFAGRGRTGGRARRGGAS